MRQGLVLFWPGTPQHPGWPGEQGPGPGHAALSAHTHTHTHTADPVPRVARLGDLGLCRAAAYCAPSLLGCYRVLTGWPLGEASVRNLILLINTQLVSCPLLVCLHDR